MASILNRTLIVPPILDHYAVALGSCPKFKVQSPKEIRVSVWDHIVELLRSRRAVNAVVDKLAFMARDLLIEKTAYDVPLDFVFKVSYIVIGP
ncbi:hypothetical protein V6N13_095217 [Hibiscus sabdariffa]